MVPEDGLPSRGDADSWRTVRRLVHCVARETDPHGLIFSVAYDQRLIEASKTIYVEVRKGRLDSGVLELCSSYGISGEYFIARIGVIVHALHLVEHPENCYEMLGVTRNASRREIKRSYRKLSMAWHPDRHPDGNAAAGRFRDIHLAYRILSEDGLRQVYNRKALIPFWGEWGTAGEVESARRGRALLVLLYLAVVALLVLFAILITRDVHFAAKLRQSAEIGRAGQHHEHVTVSKSPEARQENSVVISPPDR